MSHNPEAVIDCPNCGYKAQYNYCSRCGQATHLHKDTFWGLIVHFVGHYFHYDSKFWSTIKTLWIKPGALTIAYRNKQRMRFIDPISLYIFVSAVFFLSFFTVMDGKIAKHEWSSSKFEKDTVGISRIIEQEEKIAISKGAAADEIYENDFERRLAQGTAKSFKNNDSLRAFMKAFIHTAPKVVFFMIPFMALFLKLLFIRRKDTFFVDHGIFSLHFHTFWFTLMLLWVVNPFPVIKEGLSSVLEIASVLYFIIALRKVYNLSILRSISYSLVIGSVYFVFLLVIIFIGAGYTLYQQG